MRTILSRSLDTMRTQQSQQQTVVRSRGIYLLIESTYCTTYSMHAWSFSNCVCWNSNTSHLQETIPCYLVRVLPIAGFDSLVQVRHGKASHFLQPLGVRLPTYLEQVAAILGACMEKGDRVKEQQQHIRVAEWPQEVFACFRVVTMKWLLTKKCLRGPEAAGLRMRQLKIPVNDMPNTLNRHLLAQFPHLTSYGGYDILRTAAGWQRLLP